jgi:hypothetical protein
MTIRYTRKQWADLQQQEKLDRKERKARRKAGLPKPKNAVPRLWKAPRRYGISMTYGHDQGKGGDYSVET